MQVSIHPRAVDYSKPNYYAKGYKTLDWDDLLPEIMLRHVWSGIVWADGHRKSANFLSASWAVLDFDEPNNTLADISNRVCDMVHVIGTTKSHQKPKGDDAVVCDRFRLALAFSRTITVAEEYEHNMKVLIARFGCDEACKDAGRFFWPCQEIAAVNLDRESYVIDVEDFVPPPVIVRPPARHARMGFVLPKARRVIEQGCFPGEGRNKTSRWVYLHLRGKGYDPDSAFSAAFSKIDLPRDEIKAIQISSEKFIARQEKKRLASEASLAIPSPPHPGENDG